MASKTLRQLKFKVLSSDNYSFTEVVLLEELPLENYIKPPSWSFDLNDNDIYIDVESRTLWKVTKRINEIDYPEVILMTLQDGTNVEEYNTKTANAMYNLRWLKDNFVEWYCR